MSQTDEDAWGPEFKNHLIQFTSWSHLFKSERVQSSLPASALMILSRLPHTDAWMLLLWVCQKTAWLLIHFKYSAFAPDTNVCTFFPKLCSGGRMGGWGGMCFDWCELEPVENKTHSEFTCFKYCLFICTLCTPGLGLIKQQWRVEVYMACFTGLGVLSLTAQNNMNLGSGLAWNAGPTWPLWVDNTSKDPRMIWSLL